MIINVAGNGAGGAGGGSFIQVYADDPEYIKNRYISVLQDGVGEIFAKWIDINSGITSIQIDIEETGYYTINVYEDQVELDDDDIIETKRIYVDSLTTSYSVKIGPDTPNTISYNATGGFKFFDSDGWFTVPDGVSAILVSGTGGGGGGASGGGGGSYWSSNYHPGGGGGAGGTAASGVYGIDCMVPVNAGDYLKITVGTGGTGGAGHTGGTAGGNGNDGNDGEDGTASEIIRNRTTALISFPGGGGGKKGMGGIASSPYSGGAGGAGGASGTIPSNISGITGVFGGKAGSNGGTGGGSGTFIGTGGTVEAADDALMLGTYRRLFGNAFGCGGSGSDGTDGKNNSQSVANPQSGGNGKNGCILICWGTWKYDDVAQLLKWDEKPNESTIRHIQRGSVSISTSSARTSTGVPLTGFTNADKMVAIVNGAARYYYLREGDSTETINPYYVSDLTATNLSIGHIYTKEGSY